MNKILESASSGCTFNLGGGIYQLALHNFQSGGSWVLYSKAPDTSEWIDLDITFRESGIQRFEAIEGLDYKLEDGATGAVAYVYGVNGGIARNIEQIA